MDGRDPLLKGGCGFRGTYGADDSARRRHAPHAQVDRRHAHRDSSGGRKFQRDFPREPDVLGFIDDTHAAFAEFFEQAVIAIVWPIATPDTA
jgi:hypothetical protein